MILCCSLVFFAGLFPVSGIAAEKAEEIVLPAPQKEGGKPLMEALSLRQSNRMIRPDAVSDQDLSNLLWAAWGINRQDSGHRTIPTAMNKQNAELYAAFEKGVWRYDAAGNKLVKVSGVDYRNRFDNAPLILVYAAEDAPFAEMHVGSMHQDVGLYCASAGLANVVKQTGLDIFKDAFPLPKGYRLVILQLVGLPK